MDGCVDLINEKGRNKFFKNSGGPKSRPHRHEFDRERYSRPGNMSHRLKSIAGTTFEEDE